MFSKLVDNTEDYKIYHKSLTSVLDEVKVPKKKKHDRSCDGQSRYTSGSVHVS